MKRALCAIFLAACSSTATGSSGGPSSGGTSGSSGTTGTPSPPPDGPPPSPQDCGHIFAYPANANCQTKLDAACCAEEATCSNDFDCVSIVSCSHTCNHDAACIDDCVNRHSSGSGDFYDVVACADTSGITSGDCAWP